MYMSTVMVVFKRSKTEPVSPRKWRTVASFMEKVGEDDWRERRVELGM